ncbi:MAG: hypothetical protein QFB86_01515 [Patescibacteria group bacterium]|nr:hypothetical protein [Patescibacteria group bacterium]
MLHNFVLFISVFLASVVEGVEALTIVLAIGTTRGWRSAWYGTIAAFIILALFVAVLGPGLTVIPISVLRIVVGGLLLIFGLQWLRKAILRESGFKPKHDETAIYKKTAAAARTTKGIIRHGAIDDWYAFTVAFKSALLEGLEVAFIVVTFGASQGSIPLATAAALTAIFAVILAGTIIHKPLAKVPENTLKFVVGIMLTSFGIFWSSEGIGIHWPGSELALLAIIAFIAVTSVLQVSWLKQLHATVGKKA